MRQYKYEGDVLYIKCNTCGEFKTVDKYDKGKNYKFGLNSSCKECKREYSQKRYSLKRDYIAKQNQEYYRNNKTKTNEHKRKYRLENKEKLKEKAIILNNQLGFNRHAFHLKTIDYIKKNGLRPTTCSICGCETIIETHHPSYKRDDWKMVVFCCKSCHRQIHSGRIECPEPVDLFTL